MKIAQPSTVLVYLPLYIALEGAKHELVSYGGPREALEAVAHGQADVAIGDPFLFDYLDYASKKLVIIAGFARKLAHALITFDPFIQKADVHSLSGKTIVSYPEPSTSYFISRNLAEEYSLGPHLETPFNTELSPLLTQEADLAVVIEPNKTYAVRNGAKVLRDFAEHEAVLTGFCATDFVIKQKSADIKSLFTAVKKGIATFQNDALASFAVAQKYFPLVDEAVLKEAVESLRSANMYCNKLTFTDKDIAQGCAVRKIKTAKAEKFIRYL